MHWALLLFLPAGELPQVEVLPPAVSASRVERDVRNMPTDHFHLIEQARRLDDDNREDYFSRLANYLDEASDCSNVEKVTWFLEMASRTHSTAAVREVVAPRLNRIIIEQPACFLAALDGVAFMAQPAQVLDRFVIEPGTADAAVLQEALHPLLVQAEYESLARLYDQRIAAQAERRARETARQQRQLAMERRQYRSVLKDAEFLKAEPERYWNRWEEISRKSRDCRDHEAIADLLDAAVMHAWEGVRHRSAEFVELLAIYNPACMLNSFGHMRERGAFIASYLLDPALVSETELLAPLAYAPVDNDARKHQQAIHRMLKDHQRTRLMNSTSEARFLLGSTVVYVDDAGRILVNPPSRPGSNTEDHLDALWEQATPAGNHRGRNYEIRLLPLEALDFMTNGEYPHYQLLRIDRESVQSIKARPVGAAILEWFCHGKLLALELAPESSDDETRNRFGDPVLLELSEDVALPEAVGLHYDEERWYITGRLSWPATGRSMDFDYGNFTGTEFHLQDNQTGEKRYASRTGWSCH